VENVEDERKKLLRRGVVQQQQSLMEVGEEEAPTTDVQAVNRE
jgi:hypothetical protein